MNNHERRGFSQLLAVAHHQRVVYCRPNLLRVVPTGVGLLGAKHWIELFGVQVMDLERQTALGELCDDPLGQSVVKTAWSRMRYQHKNQWPVRFMGRHRVTVAANTRIEALDSQGEAAGGASARALAIPLV